jgi:hypothetical protein
VLTLREPFYPAKRRLKFYLLFSFILATFISITSIRGSNETCLAPSYAATSEVQNASLAVVLSLYILVSLFSIIYAARMLSRPGISSDIRQIFMKKHVLYAVSFIVIWSTILLNAYDQLYTNDNHPDHSDTIKMYSDGYSRERISGPMGYMQYVWIYKQDDKNYMLLKPVQVISFIASISTGFIMGIIRCLEPYFHFLLKKTIKAFYGIPLSEEEIDQNNNQLTDTIAAFLNSSLNIELVHIILKAISQECTKTSIPADDWKINIALNSQFDEVMTYPINEIEVKDAKKWKLFDEPVKGPPIGFNVLGDQNKNKQSNLFSSQILFVYNYFNI